MLLIVDCSLVRTQTLLPSGERLLLEGDDKLIYEKTMSFAVDD